MAFKGLDFFMRQRLVENRAYMAHVSEEVKELLKDGSPITTEKYERMYLNSYERALLYPLMTDECFVGVVRYCLMQAGSEFEECRQKTLDLPSTYNDTLKKFHIHELLRRLERKDENGR